MNSLSELNTFSATGVPYYNAGTSTTVTSAYRYAFNGVVSTDKTVMQNLEAMATACGSWMSYDSHDGKWSVVINKSDNSIASFTDANIIGPITVSGSDINELYNQVKCQFPHIDLKDNLDYVNVEIPVGDRNANEPINSLDMQFDILNDPVQAQLLGTINLKQSRIDKIIRFTSDYSKLGLKAGNVIDITSDIYGFTAKKFRITSLIEKDADDGSIQLDITALEYDENVYSTSDLYRYVVSNSTGIIGIGSIGKPGLPEVVKTEVASLPKITVTSTAPTGIVEAMEFWYTRDVPPGNNVDSTRSYSLLGTVKPTNGTTFTYGTAVSLDVSTLGSGNFLIKSRGVNTTTAGQYSDPSGVVYYAPVQITDGIGEDTALYDSTGALIATLGVNYLLNNLDQLFKGNVSIGSIFDQLFGLFNEETGVDLITQANTGTTLLGITYDGTTITSTAANIEFTGTGVTSVYASGNDVTVTIDGGVVPGTGISFTGENNNVVTLDLVTGPGLEYNTTDGILSLTGNGSQGNANVTPGFSTVKAGNTIGTTSSIQSSNSSTITFVAGPGTDDGSKIFITTNPGSNIVTIDLQLSANASTGGNGGGGGGGNTVVPVTSYTSTLKGTVFPMVFGSGPKDGEVDSRAGIFTHDHMVFAGSNVGGAIKSNNIISTSKSFEVSVEGNILDFYKFPSLSNNWSQKPWYDDLAPVDKYGYDSKLSLYYSTATYVSGSLDSQSWSPWTLVNSNNGVTGFSGSVIITVDEEPATYANYWSNPAPTIYSQPSDEPYIVEEIIGDRYAYVSGTFPDATQKANAIVNSDKGIESARFDKENAIIAATRAADAYINDVTIKSSDNLKTAIQLGDAAISSSTPETYDAAVAYKERLINDASTLMNRVVTYAMKAKEDAIQVAIIEGDKNIKNVTDTEDENVRLARLTNNSTTIEAAEKLRIKNISAAKELKDFNIAKAISDGNTNITNVNDPNDDVAVATEKGDAAVAAANEDTLDAAESYRTSIIDYATNLKSTIIDYANLAKINAIKLETYAGDDIISELTIAKQKLLQDIDNSYTALSEYDPFKANILIVNQLTPLIPAHSYTEFRNDLSKTTSVATGNTTTTITFPGGANDLIMFGVSVFNAPDATAVSNNTVFGHATPHFVNTYPDSRAFKQVANNGSRFVAISATDSSVYWSDDGMNFDRVKLDSAVTNVDQWIPSTAFEFVIYNNGQFIVLDTQNGCATSSDGKTWTEHWPSQGIDELTRQVASSGSSLMAVGPAGIQTSADGIEWTAPVVYSAFNGYNVTSVVWDGSQWLVGSKMMNKVGSALYTSADGVTWTSESQLSDPNASQVISSANYNSLKAQIDLMNTTVSGMLPA